MISLFLAIYYLLAPLPPQPAGAWVCEGNSYMMLEPGWKPKPPQCQWVSE
jgi:hypothetical protein